MSDHHIPEREGARAAETEAESDSILPLALVAHEIRGPAAVIHTSVTLVEALLATAGTSSPELSRALERLRRNAVLIARLTEDLADLGRAQLGPASLERRPADLVEIVAEVLSSLPDEQRARVSLGAPSAAPLVCDPRRMGQVMSNLVRNGLEHSHGPVDVGLFAVPQGWTVSVENDGTITPDLRRRLFQPFVRGHAGGRGFGVGLYVVRRFVEAHGGVVVVESQGGRVRFAVTLRIEAAPVTET